MAEVAPEPAPVPASERGRPTPAGSGPDRGAPTGATYAGAGVDIRAGEEAVRRIGPAVRSTFGPEVLGGLGGFAGLFALPEGRWRHPVLAATTDGVGTKSLVARWARRYDTIGIDLVAMCVDDLVCAGAEPLFLLDYYATGHLDPAVAVPVVAGVAEGCRRAGCALLGGEMAEHGGDDPGAFDLAGSAVGVVDSDRVLGPHRVRSGDYLIGLPSPGLRANGYSLARRVLFGSGASPAEPPSAGPPFPEPPPYPDDPAWPGAARSLADELLLPSEIYAPAVIAAAALEAGPVRAAAHITGGGLPANLARVLPPTCDAELDPGSWDRPRIFSEIQSRGQVAEGEMVQVFNLGRGMVLVVAPEGVGDVTAALAAHGREGLVVGRVVEGRGRVTIG
ncbi:MAG: phosphoribosylformylglycinamidine cyclo-ligase, partial [Acidimicrobiales bacterium]